MKGKTIFLKNNLVKRILALATTSSMSLTMCFNPAIAYAEEITTDGASAITSITAIDDNVAVQYMELGSKEEDIIFPDSFTATVETTKEVIIEEQVPVEEKTVEEEPVEVTETEPAEMPEEEPATEPTEDLEIPAPEVAEELIEESTEAPTETSTPAETEPTSEEAPVEIPAETPVTEAPATDVPADPVAFIIDKIFPAMVVKAAEETIIEEPEEPVMQTVQRIETITSTSEITLTGVTWTIDALNSTNPTFDSSIEGASYVYVANIPTSYIISAPVPTIKVIIGTNGTSASFRQSVVVDGVVITVKADEGVFPEGALLTARAATAEETEVAEVAVAAERESANVASSYTFDIKVLNSDGVEIQPDTTKGTVKVEFAMEEARAEYLEADIYHISDANPAAPVAEKLETENTDNIVEAETTGFSFYTVEFTYNGLQYVMKGGTIVLLSEILDYIGIEGNVVSAESSDESLFYAKRFVKQEENQDAGIGGFVESEAGDWYIVSLKAFTSEESLVVTMDNGTSFDIVVTDDPGLVGAHSDTNSKGDVFLGGNYIEVGVAKTGSFGTAGEPSAENKSKFHPIERTTLGLSVDGDGFENGNTSTTGDFFLPGTPAEQYILGYKIDGIAVSNNNAERCYGEWESPKVAPTTVDKSNVAAGLLKSVTTGTTKDGVDMEMTISFNENDMFFITDVVITNNTGKDITDVRWVRAFDPDQDADLNGEYNTYNKVISNPNSKTAYTPDQCAMVVAKGGKTQEGFFFAAFDERARAAIINNLAVSSAYDESLWMDSDSIPTVPAEASYAGIDGFNKRDTGIAITFACGTLKAGASTTLSYYSSLDPDVSRTFSQLSGKVNYVKEVIEGFEPDTTYDVTIEGDESGTVYKVKANSEGQIKLEGKDTSDKEYSLLGKTVHISLTEEDVTSTTDIDVNDRPTPTEIDSTGTLDDGDASKPEEVGKDLIVTTDDSITITAGTNGQEYGIADSDSNVDEWIGLNENESHTFDGLDAGDYTLKTRVKATYKAPASLPSKGITITLKPTATVKPHENTVADYDGAEKTSAVETEDDGVKITYSTSPEMPYSATEPKFTDAGTYTVYYKATKDGCRTTYGSYTVTINKQKRNYVEVEKTYNVPAESTENGTLEVPELCEEPELIRYEASGDIKNYINDVKIIDGKVAYDISESKSGTTGVLRLYVQGKNDEPYWIEIPITTKAAPAPSFVNFTTEETTKAPALELLEVDTQTEERELELPDAVQKFVTGDLESEKIEETIDKGNIIDRGDIWGEMTDDSKRKLLDKLNETGGEIVKLADEAMLSGETSETDAEDNEKVPVKEKPIALVMGEGAIVVKLETPVDSRNTAGLADAKAVAKSILTEEQYAMVAAGSILEIKVEVIPLDDETIPEFDKQVITDGVAAIAEEKPNLAMADYIDISMFMRIDDSDWNQITDTDPIDIIVDIPENYKGLSDTYYIMRAHEGVSTLLEDLDDDDDTITISTGQFSTYALMFDDVSEVPVAVNVNLTAPEKCQICHVCPTFLGICYFVWLAIITVAAGSIMLYMTLRKKND